MSQQKVSEKHNNIIYLHNIGTYYTTRILILKHYAFYISDKIILNLYFTYYIPMKVKYFYWITFILYINEVRNNKNYAESSKLYLYCSIPIPIGTYYYITI